MDAIKQDAVCLVHTAVYLYCSYVRYPAHAIVKAVLNGVGRAVS